MEAAGGQAAQQDRDAAVPAPEPQSGHLGSSKACRCVAGPACPLTLRGVAVSRTPPQLSIGPGVSVVDPRPQPDLLSPPHPLPSAPCSLRFRACHTSAGQQGLVPFGPSPQAWRALCPWRSPAILHRGLKQPVCAQHVASQKCTGQPPASGRPASVGLALGQVDSQPGRQGWLPANPSLGVEGSRWCGMSCLRLDPSIPKTW